MKKAFGSLALILILSATWGWNKIDLVQKGSLTYAVNALRLEMNDGFHSYWTLENGAMVGQRGSLTYLLYSDFSPRSRGFHTIVSRQEGGYDATLGNECFKLSSDGRHSNGRACS